MILSDVTLKKYLPVNTLKDVSVTDTHQLRAWNKHFPKLIGRDLMTLADSLTEADDLVKAIEPALANLTLMEAIPWLDLVLTTTGFGIVSNDNIAPASSDRVKNLARAAAQAANDSLDRLLYLVETTDDWADVWNKSCLIKGGLIKNTTEMQQQIDINESPLRFYALKTNIELYQRKRIETMVGKPQIDALLKKRTDTQVLPLLRKALAFYALTQEDVKHHDTADDYLRLAIRHMIDNPSNYPLYHTYMYESRHENIDTSGFMILG